MLYNILKKSIYSILIYIFALKLKNYFYGTPSNLSKN
jgi:hypothetical protein